MEEARKKTGFSNKHMGQDLRKKGREGEDELGKTRESERLLQKEIPRHGQGCEEDDLERQEGLH